MLRDKKPLYRKVNTRARNVWHNKGGDYSRTRNAKPDKDRRAERGSMGATKQRGLDYTPLFRFLLSKVGEDWDAVHSEAVSRLDKEEPVWWMVARSPADRHPYFITGEATFFSGLYIDESNRLALVDPELKNEDLEPRCPCCTHTFNGEPLVNKFVGWWEKTSKDDT